MTEAQEIVRDRIAASDTDFLFPAYRGQPISDAAMATLMKRAGLDARPHGFRASFRTWGEEQTDAQFEVKRPVWGMSSIPALSVPTSARIDLGSAAPRPAKRWP